MIRGTTPTHTFILPFDAKTIDKIKITYSQLDRVILTKKDKDITINKNEAVVVLTQADTFKFSDKNGAVSIQIRVLTTGGDALASKIMTTSVGKCLDSEVL